MARRLQDRRTLAPGTPEHGHAFEAWILHELAAFADTARPDAEIAYWRTRTGLEVDFVVADEVAIEAKTTRDATARDLKGLRAIAEESPFRHRILVCNEPLERRVDGVEILPWRIFVTRLWNGELF